MKKILLFMFCFFVIVSCKKDHELVYSGPPSRFNIKFLAHPNGWVVKESKHATLGTGNLPLVWQLDAIDCSRHTFTFNSNPTIGFNGETQVIYNCIGPPNVDFVRPWSWIPSGNMTRIELYVKDFTGNNVKIRWNLDSLSETTLIWARNSYGDSLVSEYSH